MTARKSALLQTEVAHRLRGGRWSARVERALNRAPRCRRAIPRARRGARHAAPASRRCRRPAGKTRRSRTSPRAGPSAECASPHRTSCRTHARHSATRFPRSRRAHARLDASAGTAPRRTRASEPAATPASSASHHADFPRRTFSLNGSRAMSKPTMRRAMAVITATSRERRKSRIDGENPSLSASSAAVRRARP